MAAGRQGLVGIAAAMAAGDLAPLQEDPDEMPPGEWLLALVSLYAVMVYRRGRREEG